MNVFSRIAKGIKNAITPAKSVDMQSQELLEWLGISSTPKKLVSEVTYLLKDVIRNIRKNAFEISSRYREGSSKG